MNEISILKTKLTELQENILMELNKTVNMPFICKKLNIKPITLSKTIQLLNEKELIKNNELTAEGKKMVNYLNFRNDTILLFLNKIKLHPNEEYINQLGKLNYKIIIAIKNLI